MKTAEDAQTGDLASARIRNLAETQACTAFGRAWKARYGKEADYNSNPQQRDWTALGATLRRASTEDEEAEFDATYTATIQSLILGKIHAQIGNTPRWGTEEPVADVIVQLLKSSELRLDPPTLVDVLA